MISKEDIEKVAKNTQHFYKALVANGYYLPPLKNQFCS